MKLAEETFALYLFNSDGFHDGKELFEGTKALCDAAMVALETGEYSEIRATDLLDRMVLHIVGDEVVFPTP